MSNKIVNLKQKYLNKRFTRLLIIDVIESDDRNNIKCICDCGNIVIKNIYDICKGDTQSCGCLRAELTRNRRRENLLNLKFGKLTVIEYIGSCKKGSLWKCLCDCGNTHSVAT